MKKVILSTAFFLAFGSAIVSANGLTNVSVTSPEKEMSVKTFYWVVTYSYERKNNCTIKYKHLTKYFFGYPIKRFTTIISKDCSGNDTGGGGYNPYSN